jgi:hypothetical protein
MERLLTHLVICAQGENARAIVFFPSTNETAERAYGKLNKNICYV